jgi:hypothetical protein
MHEMIIKVQLAMFSVMLDKFAELERLILALTPTTTNPTWGQLQEAGVTWGDLEGHQWGDLRSVTQS